MTVPWFSTDQVLPAAPKIALPLLTSTAPSDAIVSGEAYLPLVLRTTSDVAVCPLIIDTESPRRLVCCPVPLGRQAKRGAATVLQPSWLRHERPSIRRNDCWLKAPA